MFSGLYSGGGGVYLNRQSKLFIDCCVLCGREKAEVGFHVLFLSPYRFLLVLETLNISNLKEEQYPFDVLCLETKAGIGFGIN